MATCALVRREKGGLNRVETLSVPSWFPWNGSKRWLLNDLVPIFSLWNGSGRYIEPFVGGRSVSATIRSMFPGVPQVLSDANPWLVSAYESQLSAAIEFPANYSDVQYWRNLTDADLSNLSVSDRANRFAICLFTAWGNRWETKPDGIFRSTVNSKYCEPQYLKQRLTDFWRAGWLTPDDSTSCCDWKVAVAQAQPGDLVYIDPPYPESLGYGNQWWSFSDQLDVVDWVTDSVRNGVNIIVSNMATIERLYKRGGLETRTVTGPKRSQTRKIREELIAWYLH